MLLQKTSLITEANLYAGFNSIIRTLIKYWKDSLIEIGGHQTTHSTIANINQHLLTHNVVIFFDHHYAFDAIPASLTLGQTLHSVSGALIPYAVHLDMGVNPQGLPSFRYWLRTLAFSHLIKNIHKANPTIHFYSIAREFELENPKLKAIVDSQYPGSNTKYIKRFTQLFTQHRSGYVCILSPMAGIAFPEKPPLHRQVYRSMEIVQEKSGQLLPFYFVGAYPRLSAHYHYFAPLLSKHTIVVRGPFNLPIGDYEQAYAEVATYLGQLRQAAQFTPPDYSRISRK